MFLNMLFCLECAMGVAIFIAAAKLLPIPFLSTAIGTSTEQMVWVGASIYVSIIASGIAVRYLFGLRAV